MAKSIKDEDILLILKQIKESSGDTFKHVLQLDKKLDLHIQKTEYELSRIRDTDDMQNKLLDQHIEGVRTLKEMHALHEKKDEEMFKRLEEPRRWMIGFMKVFTIFGTIAGALAGFLKLIGKL